MPNPRAFFRFAGPIAALCAFAAIGSACFAADPPAHYATLPLTMDTSRVETAPLDAAQKEAVLQWSKAAEQAVRQWYPRIVETLGAENAPPLQSITIMLDPSYDGVAAAAGSVIHVSPKYVAAHPNDVGMAIHEVTHVVQRYPRYDPVWLVEGIADYVRFFAYEPVSARPHPDPSKVTYHDSYRTTASFLDFVARRYNSRIVERLDHALRTDTYTPALWKTETCRDLEFLGKEWLTSLAAPKQQDGRFSRAVNDPSYTIGSPNRSRRASEFVRGFVLVKATTKQRGFAHCSGPEGRLHETGRSRPGQMPGNSALLGQ